MQKLKIPKQRNISYMCHQCEVSFTTKSNLKRHMSNVHNSNEEKLFKCETCSKTFVRKDNYARHIKFTHPPAENLEYCECWYCGVKCRSKDSIRRHILTKHQDSKFECAICGTSYRHKNYLLEHFKKFCPKKRNGQVQKCSLCGVDFPQKIIFQHYQEDHGVDIVKENLQFPTVEEFFCWKKNLEISTNSRFIVSYSNNLQRYKFTAFRCHRSGPQIVKCCNRSKRMKVRGSKKLNAICPAEIKLRQNIADSTCQVSFLKTHVGHDLSPTSELGHLSRPKSEQLQLAADIVRGVPFNDIINEQNCDDILSADFLHMPANRVNLLTRTDLHSIEHLYNVKCKENTRLSCQSREDDAENDEAELVEEFIERYSYCFIYYKRQDELPDEKFPFLEKRDILMVFMSPSQELLLQKHGNSIIALDVAHTTHSDYFIMHTMLVLDYDCEGIPIAFTITNRNNMDVIEVFLTCIKEKVGILQPNTLMTDMHEIVYDYWKSIMGTPPFRLFCTWHVKKTWEQNLISKISNVKKRYEMKKAIYRLMVEPNIDIFYQCLEELLRNEAKETANFFDYFKHTFINTASSWAYCYRQSANVHVNLHVEAFYDALKYIHSREKKFANLYSMLTFIIEYVKEILTHTIIKYIRGKLTKKLCMLRKAHDAYAEFAARNEIRFEVEKDEEEWRIQSFQTPEDESICEMYTVRKFRGTCPAKEDIDYGKCNLLCDECQVCAHLYRCTCVENAVKNNMCQHIHAVASIFGSGPIITEYEETVILTNEDFSTPKDSISNLSVNAKVEENLNTSEINLEIKEILGFDELEEYKEKLLKVVDEVKSLVSDTQDKNVLKVIDKLLTSSVDLDVSSNEM